MKDFTSVVNDAGAADCHQDLPLRIVNGQQLKDFFDTCTKEPCQVSTTSGC